MIFLRKEKHVEPTAFTCAACKKVKTSKNVFLMERDNFVVEICNGCYGQWCTEKNDRR